MFELSSPYLPVFYVHRESSSYLHLNIMNLKVQFRAHGVFERGMESIVSGRFRRLQGILVGRFPADLTIFTKTILKVLLLILML